MHVDYVTPGCEGPVLLWDTELAESWMERADKRSPSLCHQNGYPESQCDAEVAEDWTELAEEPLKATEMLSPEEAGLFPWVFSDVQFRGSPCLE